MLRRKRIAVVSDVIYPWTTGGAELRYYELYRRIAERHEVHYFTMLFPDMPKKFRHKGMIIHAISKAPDGLYVNSRRKIFPTIRFTIALLFSLARYNFDVIDSNEFPYFPNLIIKIYTLFRRKTLFVSTWLEHWPIHYWLSYLGTIGGLIGYSIQMLSLKMPHRFIAISDHTRDQLLRYTNISENRIDVVWCGIDTPVINEILETANPPTPYRIVFMGRLIQEKRVDLLIDLVVHLQTIQPEIHLVVIGDGPLLESLKEKGQNQNVVFLGRVPKHEDLLRTVAESSIYISMSEREGFNISALEACELGLPSFVRIVCFEHENLHKLTPNNYESILSYFAGNRTATLKDSNPFSWDVLSKQMESLLEL